VREAVMSVGLTPALGARAALVAIVASRALTLAADVLLWLATRNLRTKT
jgi:hypothetical protein